MKVERKLLLIIASSVILVTIPAIIGIYYFSSERILAREAVTLAHETDARVKENIARLEAVEPVLRSVSRMMQETLSAPEREGEEAAFDLLIEQDADRAWRSRQERFDGHREAGIFMPPDIALTPAQKRLHLRAKHVLDTFGISASWRFGNIWMLTPDRTEIIYDTHFPNFVYLMEADSDYTTTPWVTLADPKINPQRDIRWTPPLFDPAPKNWMVSAVYPLDINGQWVGTIGQDLELNHILSFLLRSSQRYPGEQHFMRDQQGHYILAGPWQEELSKKAESFKPGANQQSLTALLDATLTNHPTILSQHFVLDNKTYMVIGMLMQPMGWHYFRMIPRDEILAPTRHLVMMLIGIMLLTSLLIGILITFVVRHNIVSPLKLLADAVRRYGTGDLSVRANSVGQDEISETARDFNKMATHLEQKQKTEAALTAQYQNAKNQLEATLNAIPDLIFELGLDGRYYNYHPSDHNFLDMLPESFIGKTVFDVLPLDVAETIMSAVHKAHESGQSSGSQFALNFPHGELWFELSVARKPDVTRQEPRFIVLSRDITERKHAEAEIHALAFYDPLTGTPNRRLLMDRLNQAIISCARNGHYGALLFIDLDNFKTLNDTKGHAFGDLLLIEIARRLKTCTRENDTVSRLGGDEFVVILSELSADMKQAASYAEVVGEKILSAIHQSYNLNGEEHHSSASVGISLFRDNSLSVEEVLKRTDAAMYQAKSAGRNTLRFFDPAMQTALEYRLAMENGLRQAIEKQQLVLYYQMQVNHSRKILGAEALLRWLHPEQGLVPPQEFIPLCEETGLIIPIGHWVLETACHQLKQWETDPMTRDLQLAVNVSARQFHQSGFVAEVKTILEQTGTIPTRLKLELTESAVLSNIAETIAKMEVLKEIGVHFSVDDFGTGNSSLAYLTQLPLNQLKIDQSFVRNIGIKPTDAVIVRTIIGMAENLNMDIIAEGVETETQREFLLTNGCQTFQGYLFSKPLPKNEFEHRIRNTFEQPSSPHRES